VKIELLPLLACEEETVWDRLPGSPLQKVLHNEIVRKIFTLRDSIEDAKIAEVPELQAGLKAHKFLLGLLYRKNTLPTK
jgi:hypothetical protein